MERRSQIEIASAIEADPEAVWERITSPEGINYELRPLMRMTVPKQLAGGLDPERVPVGETIGRSWVLALGFLPFEYDDLRLERIDPPHGFLERGSLMTQRRWEHERTVAPADGGCLVTDRVSWEPRLPLPGRILRPLFRAIFRHRHRRLRGYFGGAPAPSD